MAKEPKRIFLTEDEMPTRWYNVRADMKNKPAPMLHPGTHKPLTLEEMTPIFWKLKAAQPELPTLPP